MATTKKTTTRTTAKTATKTATAKTTTVAEPVAENVTNEEAVVTETVIEKPVIVEKIIEKVIEKPVEQTKKTFTDSDYILCRSVWSGGLNVISQSGNLYEFRDFGSECEINYRDLVTMIRRGSEHVFLPRFMILDEDFLAEYPTVKKVYGNMYTMNDLVDILSLPNSQMIAEITKLPESVKDTMKTVIATHIANGKLDSISKVRELSTYFDSDFNLLSDLFVK